MLFLIRVPLILFWIALSALWGILVGVCRPFNPNNIQLMTRVLNFGNVILGLDIEVRRRDLMSQHVPAVIISNHQDNLDIFPGGKSIPKNTVTIGKRSIIFIPIFGLFYWLAGNILINRKNKKSAFSTMDDAAREIREKNLTVWIMPEGTRSKGRGLLPFKKGPFVTAIKAGVPIIPIAMSNYVGKLNFNKWYAGKIIVEGLPMISTEGKTVEEAHILKDEAYKIMKEAIDRLDSEIALHMKEKRL